MPKAKAKRTLADDLTAEDIREAFARAGSERKLKPNAALVQQGKACSSVFLVLEGALRAGSDRPIGVGAFVGEVSFLLGGVTAAPSPAVAHRRAGTLKREGGIDRTGRGKGAAHVRYTEATVYLYYAKP